MSRQLAVSRECQPEKHRRLFWFTALFLYLYLTPVLFSQSKKDSLYNPKAEIVYKGNRYKVYNNWLSGGAGYALDLTYTREIFWLGADYNFHIKWSYFQLGFFLSGKEFGNYDNNNFHAGYVMRKETETYNLTGALGTSFSSGFPLDSGKFDYKSPYKEFGAYLSGSYIYKLKYDIGIGVTGLVSYNKYNVILGGRVDLYFSGAFRGKK